MHFEYVVSYHRLTRHAGRIATVSLLAAQLACGPTDPPPVQPLDVSVTGLRVADVANNDDALDIQVAFSPPTAVQVTEYRIYVVPEADAGSFDPNAAAAVPADRIFTVPFRSAGNRFTLPANHPATNGSTITEGPTYRVFVETLVQGSIPDVSLAQSLPLTLANVDAVGTIAGPMDASGDIAMTPDGDMLVADFGQALGNANGRNIYRISSTGVVSLFVNGQSGAAGNELAPDGSLLQSNIAANLVRRITPDGNSTIIASGLLGPTGIAVGADNTVYVGQCTDNTVRSIDTTGTVTVFASSGLFGCPNGVTIGPNGTLYVANFGNGGVFAVNQAGQVTTLATVPGGGIGHIQYRNNEIWVVSRNGNRIWTVAMDGTPTLVAGHGSRGKQDGPALQSGWSLPNGIGVTASGDTAYVNDMVSTSSVSTLNPVVIRRIIRARR